MADYKRGGQKYFASIVAALVIVALAIGTFIYSLLKTGPNDLEHVTIETLEDGTPAVNPSGNNFPDKAPYVSPPDSPPPV